jgi:hypothetical protein
MENGEYEMKNRKWKKGIWKVGNGKGNMESRKGKMENGRWKMENGK